MAHALCSHTSPFTGFIRLRGVQSLRLIKGLSQTRFYRIRSQLHRLHFHFRWRAAQGIIRILHYGQHLGIGLVHVVDDYTALSHVGTGVVGEDGEGRTLLVFFGKRGAELHGVGVGVAAIPTKMDCLEADDGGGCEWGEGGEMLRVAG